MYFCITFPFGVFLETRYHCYRDRRSGVVTRGGRYARVVHTTNIVLNTQRTLTRHVIVCIFSGRVLAPPSSPPTSARPAAQSVRVTAEKTFRDGRTKRAPRTTIGIFFFSLRILLYYNEQHSSCARTPIGGSRTKTNSRRRSYRIGFCPRVRGKKTRKQKKKKKTKTEEKSGPPRRRRRGERERGAYRFFDVP